MENKNKLETRDLKIYIIPLLLISGIFVFSGFFLLSGIKSHFYDLRREEADKIAKSYAQSISKYSEAEELVDGLLSEKIKITMESVALYEDELSSERLIELAKNMNVDEIAFYNAEGYLLYSNLEENIGWEIYKGHPIDLFLKSDAMKLVEDIRQDVITKDYFKYGYLKMKNQGLIQVGLRANRVYAYLDRFSVPNLLLELQGTETALCIRLLNKDLEIIGTTDNQLSVSMPNALDVKENLRQNLEYSFINIENEEHYFEVIMPIYRNEEIANKDMYALNIVYSLEETSSQIRNVSLFGLIALLAIYSSIIYNMVSTFKKNEKLKKAAYYSELSGLPNKLHLEQYMERDLEKHKDKKKAVMLFRIININSINMTYGYHFGDQVLRGIGKSLKNIKIKDGKLFHFTADQFVYYLEDYVAQKELLSLADDFMVTFGKPLAIDGIDIYVSVKIGMVVIGESYHDVNSILKDATVALEETFKENKDSILYDELMYLSIQREDTLVKELRSAIDNEDKEVLYLEYQPIVDAKTGRIVSLEALARMKSVMFGRISPMEFITAAEKNFIMVELGNYLMNLAFGFIKELELKGFPHIKVGVNVSGVQLIQSSFNDVVKEKIERFDIRPEQLAIEITESMLLDNLEMINNKFRDLRKMGVRVALDDFGTGYSSFVRLHELRIDTLKIDKEFINKLENTKRNQIIGDIIKMAHRFDLIVIAEGIEQEMQRSFLIEHECDYLQGFLFSPSVSREKAIEMLKVGTL